MIRIARIAAVPALILSIVLGCGQPAASAAPVASLDGCQIFPADNVWNTPINTLAVDSHSAEYIANIGAELPMHADFGSNKYGDFGIPFNSVSQGQARVPVSFDYADESDAGPYPIPPGPKIEAGGDRHILVLEQGVCRLYETWNTRASGAGWRAGSGAVFDLGSNALRPAGWTSADAAGLPIVPGLVRHDEVAASAINHALRFTVPCSASFYIWPARHQAVPPDCPASPAPGTRFAPMGLRLRLKASVDIAHFSHDTQVILAALKKYGMIVADNGSSWYISGAPDQGWDDDTLVDELKQVHGADFEVVDTAPMQIDPNSGQARQPNQDAKRVVPAAARQGGQASYTITIGGDGSALSMADVLPAGLTLVSGPGTTPANVAAASYNSTTRTISWSDAPPVGQLVTITYVVTLDSAGPGVIVNSATLTRSGTNSQLRATLIANPIETFLPALRK
jgi:hypothetical protein